MKVLAVVLLVSVSMAASSPYTQETLQNTISSLCLTPRRDGFLKFLCHWLRMVSSLTPRPPVNLAPVFRQPLSFYVPEHIPLGTIVGTVTVEDSDGPQSPVLNVGDGPLTVQGEARQTYPGVFTTTLILTQFLDKEKRSVYTMPIHASDGKNQTSAVVTLIVLDVNEPPVFQSVLYRASINSSTPKGTAILQLLATDVDTGTPGVIDSYYIRSTDIFIKNHLAIIPPASGRLVLVEPLSSMTRRKTLEFTVGARDVQGMTGFTRVIVTISTDLTTTPTTTTTTPTATITTPTATITTPSIVPRPPKILTNNSDMDEQMYFSENEGTALFLNCEADGYPQPSYKWEKNGRSFVLGENMSLKNGTLVISGPTASDGGAYRCFATNMFGTSVSARFHLMVRFLGRFPNIPRAEMTAVVGEHLTLECLRPPYSSEYIQMDWEYNDKSSTVFEPFMPNTRIVQDARGSLIFRSVEEGDFPVGRVFRCLVSIGQSVSTTSTNITVRIRPGIDGSAGKLPNLIYSSANHVTAVAGHPLTMYCVYGGRPLPSQSWTTSVGNRSTVDNMVGTEFYIASVGTEDTGTYNCSATNQRGTRQTNYEVTVEEKAIFTSKLEDQRLMELSGGVASFKCLTHGNPSPKIDWIINGQQWHNATSAAAVREARVEIHQGTLVMSGAGPGDQMVVGCMAFNRYGSVYQEARLI